MIRGILPMARQAGLSLVEMMVGLAIGLFLTLGLFTLIANSSNAFKVQDDFARMQENATAALRYISNSVRQAGFYGYVQDPTSLNITYGSIATISDCGSATNLPTTLWAVEVRQPIHGFSGVTQVGVNALLPCILTPNFYPDPLGQQILVTRGSNGFRIPDPNNDGDLTDGIALQRNGATTIYVQADPSEGLLFYGADYATLKGAGHTRTLPGAIVRDADIFEYAAHVYYIRPCSRMANGVTCAATDDDGKPIPTLVRQELIYKTMTEVALAEGIERMSLLYGVDNAPAGSPDGIADTFTATPATADWANIVAVRVALLVRSSTPTSQYDDSAKTYDLNGDNVVDYQCTTDAITPAACSYKRKVFSQLIQLRNVAQRRGL